MKKYIISTAIAFGAFASIAAAQSYTFNNDLRLGSTGPDVVALQTWLIQNGYDIPYISQGIQAKGYYGFQTMAAVIRLQQTIGLPAYGYFGPLTRNWINTHQGGNNNSAALQVISPNGGETWQKGTTQYITWTGAPGLLNQTADIRLEYPTPACALPTAPVRCMILTRAPLTIATGLNLNSRSYAWTVGNTKASWCLSSIDNASCPQLNTDASDGQYKIQICPTNGSACDESDNNFTITSNPVVSNGAPVINGIDAPTSLSVNQTGIWTVRATDPQNSQLTYWVEWGESYAGIPGSVGPSMQSPQMQQTTTFTHSYSNAGTYTVHVTVRNAAGLTAQSSATVQVTGINTAGPLRITLPNGGEVWQKGTTQNITWTSPYYFRATYADLKLVATQPSCPAGMYCAQYIPAPYVIATNIPINQNSYSWNVGYLPPASPSGPSQIIPDGKYTIQLCEVSSNNCDSSDGTFTISSSGTGQSQVTLVSPNGGERWIANSIHQIAWRLSNSFDANARVDMYLGKNIIPPCIAIYPQPASCAGMFQPSYTLDRNIAANSIYNWIVGTDIVNNPIPAGSYTLRVCMAGSTTNCDSSDAPFTIAPAYSYYCPAGYICNPIQGY